MSGFGHLPVMAREVIELLAPRPGGVYVDGTVGGGGHSRLILEASAPDGRLIGFDRDSDALAAAERVLAPYAGRVTLLRRNFSQIGAALAESGVTSIDGLLVDLGVSSFQLDTPERGFSFQHDAPLDMRMDQSAAVNAADLVNRLPEEELARIIREYGEERWAKRIAGRIVAAREESPLETTGQLVSLIKGAIPRGAWEERLHPATRTFQALRIAVNEELTSIEECLADAVPLLNPGGRIAVISFHSLEDRIVKRFFREQASGCDCPRDLPVCVCNKVPLLRVVTNRPLTPQAEEVATNPRARSARLRAAERC